MGAFLLRERRDREPAADPPGHGLSLAKRVAGPDCELWLYRKANGGGGILYRVPGSHDFCAVVGTLVYDGLSGQAAARALFRDFDGRHAPYAKARGSYAVIACREGEWSLWTDQLGSYKVYADADTGAWSSSLLSLLDASPRRRLDTQGVYEYAFQGATYGDATVVDGIRLLPANGLYRPLARSFEAGPPWWSAAADYPSPRAALDACLGSAGRLASELVQASGGALDSALSGGYDSRLLLALLRAAGCTPRLHVYGAAQSADVRVALEIARRLQLTVEHTDKRRWRDPAARPLEAIVAENFERFDGLPTDGIFDHGADLATRMDRCADGRLMLNGGGGEIYRNFFYLPDRTFRPRELIWSFYSKYVPAFCSSYFDAAAYTGTLTAKLAATLGVSSRARLSRRDVERAYPAFRLRYWTGRNTSVNNRLGAACTPFSEPSLVAAALRIPVAWKHAGRFEAAMLARLDPELAACPSAYGHDFLHPPPWRRRLEEWLTRQRPPWLRRYSYRLQASLRNPLPDDCLAGRPRSEWLPAGRSTMACYFRLERINDAAVLARVASLEYLCRRYGLEPA